MSLSNFKVNLIIFFYVIVLFFLTRQVPFQNYSLIMNISSFLLIFFYLFFNRNSFKIKTDNILIIFFFIILTWHFIYSIFLTKAILFNSIRFFLIVITIIFAYKIKINSILIRKYFFIFIIIQSIFIILLELFLVVINDSLIYNFIRQTTIANGWGDVYTLNNIYYNIQIKGNALLPVAFMITYFKNININKKLLLRFVIFIAVFFSGNFAYLISITFFLFFISIYKIKSFSHFYKWVVYLLILILTLFYPTYTYINSKLTEKKDDSIYERYQQADLLLNEMNSSKLTFIMGFGQGATFEKITSTRDYRGSTYFELQSIYFLYQLGFFLFFLFLFVYFFLAFTKFNDKYILLVYLCYIFYSLTNPYIFDTNNFIVIILLNSLQINKFALEENQFKLKKQLELTYL